MAMNSLTGNTVQRLGGKMCAHWLLSVSVFSVGL